MRKVLGIVFTLALVLGVASAAVAAGEENSWKITAPAGGATVNGASVTLTVDPGMIKVAKPGAVVAGEGHWHFFLDGKEVGKGPANSFEFKDLTAGNHTLGVELHQGDHTPYPGAKPQMVNVTVKLPATGTNTAVYAGLGLLLLVAGAFLFRRRGAVAAR